MNHFTYIGTELELFARAKNWKNYLKFLLKRYIQGNVLEVGAGIGSNTKLLSVYPYSKWLCLEPDPQLERNLISTIKSNHLKNCYVKNQTIDRIAPNDLFDSILYLDVLEHIFDDRQELSQASQRLNIGGYLIILSPAHQWLFTHFDIAIGRYRRYNRKMLKSILPDDLKIIKLDYLDSVGLLASLSNKLILKQSQPTLKQIQIWDRLMIPLSRTLDAILNYRIGKSILLIGQKQ